MPGWNPKANDIFLEALEFTSPADQQAFIERSCGDDADLREQVESLIAASQKAGSFLEDPVFPAAPLLATINQPITEKTGTQIGPYKLLQQIGEGGMGVVYMAEQTKPVERRVALKIIKPGMDTQQVIARFEAERQALAMMDHPNIAKVLDAGTTDSGRPYFVMELVKGMPVTQYCDEQHLSPRERLELFIPVCQAVQHAHQKGIIHRDLKPSNILIARYDDKAVPKIIDFGVAKAVSHKLTEKTMFTQYGQIVGTIEYMSPEQAEFNQFDVDTRSDIYSLGVLLYELLTGETPFDKTRLRSAAFDELLRIIREEEPPRPSIRLSTSAALPSIAVNRHIEPSKLSTLVRGELDWIVMKALEKDRSRRFDTVSKFAEDIQHYLNDEPVTACPPSAVYRFRKFARRNKFSLALASTIVVALASLSIVATLTAARFRELANWNATLASDLKDALGDAETNLERAQVQQRQARENLDLARKQERQAQQNLQAASAEQERAEGNLDLALEALDAVYLDAIGIERLLATPENSSQAVTSESLSVRSLTPLEKELLRRGLKFYDQFAQNNERTSKAAFHTAEARLRVGLLHAGLGDQSGAEAAFRDAITGYIELTEKFPKSARHFQQLGVAYYSLGMQQSSWSDSQEIFQAAEQTLSKAIGLDSKSGDTFYARAQVNECLSHNEQAMKDYEQAIWLNPQIAEWHCQYGRLLKFCGDKNVLDNALALKHFTTAAELDPKNATYHAHIARALWHDPKNAMKEIDTAIALDPTSAFPYHQRSMLWANEGDLEQALKDAQTSLRLTEAAWPHQQLGEVYRMMGRFDDAIAEFSTAATMQPRFYWPYFRRAQSYVALGQLEQAKPDLDRAVALLPKFWESYRVRGELALVEQRYQAAIEDFTKALDYCDGLLWIAPELVSKCPDEEFKRRFLKLAESVVEKSSDPPRARRDRIALYLGLGELDKARDDFSVLLTPQNTNYSDHYQHALLRLTLNEAPKYRDACAAMAEKFGEANDAMAANFVAWTCALAPAAVDDYAPVLKCATRALESLPDADQFLNTLGAVHYRAGRPREAIEWLTELDRIPENSNAMSDTSPAYTWYFLAMAHQQTGNEEQARQYLNKANGWTDSVLADEENPPAWNRRATLALLRREAEALLATGGAVSKPSDHIEPQPSREVAPRLVGPIQWVLSYRRGSRFAAERDWTKAAMAFSEAIELRPDDWKLRKARGEAYENLEQWNEAIADYQRAIKRKPDEWPLWKARADNLAQSEQWDKAISLYTSLVKYDTDNEQLWRACAAAHVQLKQWDKAVEDYGQVIKLTPDDAWTYVLRSVAHRWQGDYHRVPSRANRCPMRLPHPFSSDAMKLNRTLG